jgi:hypothetical protein
MPHTLETQQRQSRDADTSASTTRTDLAKYNAAKKALAEAHRIDEVKDIRDKAVALRTYAMQAKDRVLIDHATEIRLRAERRVGQLLKEMAERGERHEGKGRKERSQPATVKLSDLGINKSQSSRWQALADIAEDKFEEVVTHAQQKASDAVDQAKAKKPKPKPKDPTPKEPTTPKEPQPTTQPEPRETNSDDPVAECLACVVPILRIEIADLTGEQRSVFLVKLREAVHTIMAELNNQEAQTNRWREPTQQERRQ